MPSPTAVWARRAVVIVLGVAAVAFAAFSWYFSSVIRDELLRPGSIRVVADLEIRDLGGGRIVLNRTEASARDGLFGVAGAGGYGQASAILEITETEVARGFRLLEGSLAPGEAVRFEAAAFPGDPETAHGIPFTELVVPAEVGVLPAWLVEGDRDTWVVVIHDGGDEQRRQALRIIPALHDAGYPVLTITLRNDAGAPAGESELFEWGMSEWRDLEAALRLAVTRGAEDFVLMGHGTGASVTAMFLHESELIGSVRGAIFDSPALDPGAVSARVAQRRGMPGPVAAAGRALASLRFGLEWSELDQVARAGQFDLPMLVMHGDGDEEVPVEISAAFAAARPDLVTFAVFDMAPHGLLWNVDPVRYGALVSDFLRRLDEG